MARARIREGRIYQRQSLAAFLDGVSRLVDPMARRNNYPKYKLRKPGEAIRADWFRVGEYLKLGIAQYEELYSLGEDNG